MKDKKIKSSPKPEKKLKKKKAGKTLTERVKSAKKGSLTRKRVDEIFQLLKDGVYAADILTIISEKYNGSRRYAQLYMSEALREYKESASAKSEKVMALHISRYEAIYHETMTLLKELEEDDIELYYKVAPIKYQEVLQTLFQKEKITGYHAKGAKPNVIPPELLAVKKDKNEFDISKLSFEEKKKLKKILFECRENKGDGIQPVIMKVNTQTLKESKKEEEEVEKDYLVLPEKVEIKIEVEKGKELHLIDELHKTSKTLVEVKEVIKTNQENLFLNLLKDKNQSGNHGKIIK